MITKDEFTNLISNHVKWDDRIGEVCTITKANIYETDWVIYGYELFMTTLNLLFKREAVEDIYWWIWEKAGRPDMKMWDETGKEIPTETLDNLWEIVKDYRK